MIYYLKLLVFPEQCHVFVHVVTAVLNSHVIMVAIHGRSLSKHNKVTLQPLHPFTFVE